MKELLVLRGIVEAAPDQVASILLDVRPGGRSPLAVDPPIDADTGNRFEVTRDGSRMTVTIDEAARSVTQEGEWWYRGITSVEPEPRGSLVVHRILNIANTHGWGMRFVTRGPLNAAPGQFAAQLQRLGELTGAKAWPLDS